MLCTFYISTDLYEHLDLNKHSPIGHGAFGTVFRGTYKGSACAAKLLTHHAQELASGMKATRTVQVAVFESFQKECRFLKTLFNENIVRHIATVTDPKSNLPMLVMELMDCSLKNYLEEKQNNSEKLFIICQINVFQDMSKGLAFLHSHNIIHRDICDDNILLDLKHEVPKAKIADFGMSRLLQQDHIGTQLTSLGHRKVYLPPEAADPAEYSYTLDVYALGVLGMQVVMVKTKIKNKDELFSLFKQISSTHLLKDIICSCLCEDRETRPQAENVVKKICALC